MTGRAGEQRLGALGCQSVRGGEIIDRKLVLLFALIEQAAAIQGLCIVGIESDGLLELRTRLLGFSGSRQRLAARRVGLRAEAAVPSPREHTTVADDMLSAAKSVFHAVLPK